MKILALHVDYIKFKPLKKALKSIADLPEAEKKEQKVSEALVILTAVEKKNTKYLEEDEYADDIDINFNVDFKERLNEVIEKINKNKCKVFCQNNRLNQMLLYLKYPNLDNHPNFL